MKIAIKGHPTRGKEVIQILESLGGINPCNHSGNNFCAYYEIHGNLIYCMSTKSDNIKYYTLEEFEEEFPFKIGDRIVSLTTGLIGTIIKFSENGIYHFKYDNGINSFASALYLKLYKEMNEERNITLTLDKAKEWYKKGGELKEIALQAFTEKELNPLPKSWEEYCKHTSTLTTSFSGCPRYDAFVKLEHLRDCWWNGWEPIWDISQKYCIYLSHNEVQVGICTNIARFLTFPTKEMAEEFLECFRDLIEQAKDLI